MGFRDMKLYNTLYEGLSLKAKIGTEIEFFEMLEMIQLSDKANDKEVKQLLDKIKENWDFEKPIDDSFLKQGIKYYLAIKKIADDSGFDIFIIKIIISKKISENRGRIKFNRLYDHSSNLLLII